MNAMKEDVGRLVLGAWILVMVVCFLGVENIQAKKPSMDKVELTTELEPDVRGKVMFRPVWIALLCILRGSGASSRRSCGCT